MSGLIKCSVIMASIPILNSTFFAFNSVPYARWFFMPTLIMALISSIALEKRSDINIPRGILYTTLATIVLVTILFFYPWEQGKLGVINHPKLFMLYVGIAFTGLLFTYLIVKYIKKELYFIISVITVLIVYSVGCGFVDIYKMQKLTIPSQEVYNYIVKSGQNLKLPSNTIYRINAQSMEWNFSMTSNYATTNSFSSTINGSIFHFYNLLGISRTTNSYIPIQYYGLNSLLSEKYIITSIKSNNERPYKTYTNGSSTIYIYKNNNYLPFGFTFDYYISENQLSKIPSDKRHFALMKALVVPNNKINIVNNYLKPLPKKSYEKMDDAHFLNDYKARKQASGFYSHRFNKGFTSKIYSNTPKIAFYSVPYDTGWKAKVNGSSVKIIESDGFMAVPVNRGNNLVRFSYEIPGLFQGIVISLISLIGLILYLILKQYKLRRRDRLV